MMTHGLQLLILDADVLSTYHQGCVSADGILHLENRTYRSRILGPRHAASFASKDRPLLNLPSRSSHLKIQSLLFCRARMLTHQDVRLDTDSM